MDIIFEKYKIVIYTDGACLNNGAKDAKGGWGFIIRFENGTKEIHSAGYLEMTTNNRMEMTPVIKALEEVKQKWPNSHISIVIFSDSQYVVKGSSEWMFKWEKKGWRRSNGFVKNGKDSKSTKISNLDLWKKMFELVNEIHPSFHWIKGHARNKYNELCDNLSVAAIDTQSDYYKTIGFSSRN